MNNDTTDLAVIDDEPQTMTRAKRPEQIVAIGPPDRLQASATDMRVVEVSEALAPAYARASTLELTDAEVAQLMAPFPDSAVDIRPHDGLIFLSHIHISDRLNAVFKPGKWALLCRRHWLEMGTLYGEYVLLIRGCFVGESVGGHQYQPNNPKTNYSDSLESTAAEALRRIAGKRLSCGSQVWHKDFAEKWVAANAEQMGGKWRKKSVMARAEKIVAPAQPAKPVPTPRAMTPEERRDTLFAKLKGFEPEMTTIFREEGLILATELFDALSVFQVERMSPDNMLALIKQVKARKADNDQLPDAEVPEPKEEEPDRDMGVVEDTNAKTGTGKNGKPYTKFGVKVSGVWYNTFSRTLFEVAMPLKGQRVRYTFKAGEHGNDLLTIESAEENTP